MRRSARFAIRKTLRYAIIIFVILSLNFMIPRMMPGSPVIALLGETAGEADPDVVARIEAEYGLDKSMSEQYVIYLNSLAHFNLGYSFEKRTRVGELITDRMFWTMVLVLPSVLIGSLAALLVGSVAGYRRGKRFDKVATGILITIMAAPGFLVSMLAIKVFAFYLDWFPLGNMTSGGKEGLELVLDVMYHYALPVTILSCMVMASKFLVVRGSVTQILHEDFIFVARSRGYRERRIASHHVMRNVLPQFISMLALSLGFAVEGALIIEIVFSFNGMGTLLYDAVLSRDYPVMQGCFLTLAVFVLLANFLADLLYGWADPRIRDAAEKEAGA